MSAAEKLEPLRSPTCSRLLELQKIGKTFHTDDVETHALVDVELTIDQGRVRVDQRPVGLGQVDAARDPRPARRADARRVPHRRQGHREARPGRSAPRCATSSIGFIFQAFNLIGDLTVEENVELPLTYRGMPAAERKKRVADALESVRMSHRARHLPAQLSGGQQQRVAVARAVAGDPLILLADEPTGNLDSKNGDAVMELLCQLHANGRDDLHGHAQPGLREEGDARRPSVRRAGGRGSPRRDDVPRRAPRRRRPARRPRGRADARARQRLRGAHRDVARRGARARARARTSTSA